MAAKNDITGDSIKSKILSKEGRENYDRIFAKNKIKNQIIDSGFDPDELVTMDGYDHCIVGIIERFDQPALICYDKEKVLLELQRDGMNEDEALEFFNFNQIGAWMGEYTPCFLTFFQK